MSRLSDSSVYYLHKGGYDSGPFSLEKLREMFDKKAIVANDFVWCEGMPDWKPLSDLISQHRTSSLMPRTPKSREHHYTPTHVITRSSGVSYKLVYILGITIVTLALYIASPFLAIYDLKKALESGDAGNLQERIDFPEIRLSIKEQIKASFMEGLAQDEQSNALATGLALAFGPALIDGLVDSIVTPSGISNLIWNAKFPSPRKDGEPLKDTEPDQKSEQKHFNFSYAWFSGPTLFKVISKDKNLVLRFHLRDFKWKLYNIELPKA